MTSRAVARLWRDSRTRRLGSKDSQRLRISAQLIKTMTVRTFGGTYDRELSDVVRAAESIAEAIGARCGYNLA
jgi:TolB-like protein